ncbi:hypothetical protein DRO55_01125 [Candidatus Bathyarchaeota archaeon]|nr:MAG: hypothetical protein DRO55_01125 [Candidatus Bathyarchaeota archaeon]
MSSILTALGRKMLGLALIFNSLMSLLSTVNILLGFYSSMPWWKPYAPYIIDGSVFWLVIPTSLLNIIPARSVGEVKIRRVIFHHYVYGFLTVLSSTFAVSLFAPLPLISLFLPPLYESGINLNNLTFYICSFFAYGGLVLILDDLYDFSSRIPCISRLLRLRVGRSSRLLRMIHLSCSILTIYIALGVGLWLIRNYNWIGRHTFVCVSHIVFMSSLLITGLFGFKVSINNSRGRMDKNEDSEKGKYINNTST